MSADRPRFVPLSEPPAGELKVAACRRARFIVCRVLLATDKMVGWFSRDALRIGSEEPMFASSASP